MSATAQPVMANANCLKNDIIGQSAAKPSEKSAEGSTVRISSLKRMKHSVNCEQLRDMYEAQQMTSREISQKLNIPFKTIIRYLHNIGVQLRPQGPDVHVELRNAEWLKSKYITQGKSTPMIAAEIGASPRVVYDWLLKHGITPRSSGSQKGHKRIGDEAKRKISASRKGKYTGPDHWMWKGGYIDPTARERRSYNAKEWRKAVKERDGYVCVKCGETERLHAHHIKSWHDFPELRFEVSNGMTLCVRCHQKEHKRYFPNWLYGETPKSAKQPEQG